jgi:choline dehydrogenase-like flavoprotein
MDDAEGKAEARDQPDDDDNNKGRMPRREFLSGIVASAAAPLLLTPKSCDQHKDDDCPPATGGAPAPPAKAAGPTRDVIVIGSGFGATVAVTQLLSADRNRDVLILERGLWWLSPDRPKPDYLARPGSREKVQYFTRPDHSEGVRYLLSILSVNGRKLSSKASPLYNLHTFGDMNVLTANGIGGGSLIYLNVTIPPVEYEEDRPKPYEEKKGRSYPIFERDWPVKLTHEDYRAAGDWMARWRGRLNHIVTEFPLRKGLDPADLGPLENLYLGKARALRQAADVSGSHWKRISPWTPAPLSIDEYDEQNPGVTGKRELEVCTRLGRCFLGCPPRAIQTLDRTLLNKFLDDPRAYPNLRLESLKEVSHIQQASDGTYNVYFREAGAGGEDNLRAYNARRVVVAAGTLGTNQILLRSKDCGALRLSDRLGHRFSGNGDLGGFILDVGQHYKPAVREEDRIRYKVYPTRGPQITSYVQYETTGANPVHMTVEDGGIPPTLAAFTRVLLNFARQPKGLSDVFNKLRELGDSGVFPKAEPILRGRPRPDDPKSYQTEQAMLENVFYFQCMGRDEPDGQFFLNGKGRLDLTYNGKDPMKNEVYARLEEIMRAMADRMGGEFTAFTSLLPNPRLFTLHPLGGCSMGEDVTRGVVDERGRVFRNEPGADPRSKAVYEGLYVMDASVFPGPVAVNPTLTIVALALKIARGIAA